MSNESLERSDRFDQKRRSWVPAEARGRTAGQTSQEAPWRSDVGERGRKCSSSTTEGILAWSFYAAPITYVKFHGALNLTQKTTLLAPQGFRQHSVRPGPWTMRKRRWSN